jgi:hypothetical protein
MQSGHVKSGGGQSQAVYTDLTANVRQWQIAKSRTSTFHLPPRRAVIC